MPLSKTEEEQIAKILKKLNRYVWKEELIAKVIDILNSLREGLINKSDFLFGTNITVEDYLFNLNLIQFI